MCMFVCLLVCLSFCCSGADGVICVCGDGEESQAQQGITGILCSSWVPNSILLDEANFMCGAVSTVRYVCYCLGGLKYTLCSNSVLGLIPKD